MISSNNSNIPTDSQSNSNNFSENIPHYNTVDAVSNMIAEGPKYKSYYKTLYMRDYKEKKPIHNNCYNPNIRTHITTSFPMDLITNNMMYYKDHKQNNAIVKQERPATSSGLFVGQSSYQNTYLDWKIGEVHHEKKPIETLAKFPFRSQSTYNKVFIPYGMECKGKRYPEV